VIANPAAGGQIQKELMQQYVLKAQGWLGWVVTTKSLRGPNDVSDVIWAMGMSFFFCFVIFVYTN
jgi:hypothetical protein